MLKREEFSDFVVYEASDSISGVWSAGYTDFAVQTPGSLYEFPDKELAQPKDYVSGSTFHKYCQEYATKNGLLSHICLQTKVTAIQSEMDSTSCDSKWKITADHKDGTTEHSLFDFVILATGVCKCTIALQLDLLKMAVSIALHAESICLYSLLDSPNLKYIPEVQGLKEHFLGQVHHSQDACNLAKERQGKKVLIVGFGKSVPTIAP